MQCGALRNKELSFQASLESSIDEKIDDCISFLTSRAKKGPEVIKAIKEKR